MKKAVFLVHGLKIYGSLNRREQIPGIIDHPNKVYLELF